MPSRRVPAAVIASVLQASTGRFHVCHGAGLPLSATISGQVLVAFVIEPDGHVSGARDAGGTFPDDAVRRCIVRAVTQLSFPKPPDGSAQQVTIPVVLQAEDAVARPR
jgi:TonB family protein